LIWTPFCRTELCWPPRPNRNQHYIPPPPPPFKIFNYIFIGYDFSVSTIRFFLSGTLFSFAIISFSYRVNNCVSCNPVHFLLPCEEFLYIYILFISLSLTHTHTHSASSGYTGIYTTFGRQLTTIVFSSSQISVTFPLFFF
jgi:hypothetical protein